MNRTTTLSPPPFSRKSLHNLERMQFSRVKIPGIKKVLTICSAKGGVGKSTTSVNVALALKNLGYSVGLADADITGPSIPTMMGVESSQVETYRVAGSDRFGPPMNFGVKVMSMGLVVPQDEAIAVRGPMVNKYIRALLFQTDWDELDYLLIDMPPGTNDVHLTVTQEVLLSGAVIVSTPQKVALTDVRRGIDMFTAVNTPVLGLVENMSYFVCNECTARHYLYGKGGVKKVAEELEVPLLGEIPFVQRIMQDTDDGVPPALRGDRELPAAKPYYDLAERIAEAIDTASPVKGGKTHQTHGPTISFE
ncbi:ATP-binding protein involved in chromosome partitioning [Angomonas deanei]|nr:ATP-binding protein involved in chromosome partitioning [Angomonas deanei]|eukprot:EPY27644.1 ATP-binding protein involved in chromosome partitioning [Angomonas deanei]